MTTNLQIAIKDILSKLPLPGDEITKVLPRKIIYASGAKFEINSNHRLKKGDFVQNISYELIGNMLKISINHSFSILDNLTKVISENTLINITRTKKLERILKEDKNN